MIIRIRKTVSLLSGIVRARNGILLLDEFETAIHAQENLGLELR